MLQGMQQEVQLGFSAPGDRGQVLLHSTIRPINETSDGRIFTVFSNVPCVQRSNKLQLCEYFHSGENPTAPKAIVSSIKPQTRTTRKLPEALLPGGSACKVSVHAYGDISKITRKNRCVDSSALACMDYSKPSSSITVPFLHTYLPPRTPNSAGREAL